MTTRHMLAFLEREGAQVLPVPAAALTAAYALLVAALFNRDLPRGAALVAADRPRS